MLHSSHKSVTKTAPQAKKDNLVTTLTKKTLQSSMHAKVPSLSPRRELSQPRRLYVSQTAMLAAGYELPVVASRAKKRQRHVEA